MHCLCGRLKSPDVAVAARGEASADRSSCAAKDIVDVKQPAGRLLLAAARRSVVELKR